MDSGRVGVCRNWWQPEEHPQSLPQRKLNPRQAMGSIAAKERFVRVVRVELGVASG